MTNQIDPPEQESLSVSVFGYELIRDVLLTDILGKECEDVLYWAGKSIARKFPCSSNDELAAFFQEAGWGQLKLIKDSKKERIYDLSGPLVERKLSMQTAPSFTLESGFLAEQIGTLEQAGAESISEILKKTSSVQLTVKWE
ncbi:putative hydrocarbon binding protein [Bacillus ectoiniformans]|uniref:YslB family protein n=1 Tax=Bacillus ectoiniformans TaxID=1494429 RepID=UPI00195B3E4E|nr:YslB family protein [Bacillus ectoiniformans]MBM7648897.1 putative hydrocarbon binding protein [Bacillus ectoiniformans]